MAYYYIDYTNGNDAHTGLRIPVGPHNSTNYNTIDSSADTTHFVDSALGSYATSALIGSYFYNVTRSAGALITANTTGTGAVTLGTAIGSMAANDTYYILDSWKTVPKYTSGTTRSVGDWAYVRANQTHTLTADLVLDESGTYASPIALYGCNATQSIDPYHDASDVNAKLDFGYAAYKFSISASVVTYSWRFKNLTWQNSNITSYCLLTMYQLTYDMQFYNCVFDMYFGTTQLGSSTTYIYGSGIIFENCTFHPVYGVSPKMCYHPGASAKYINCTWKKYTNTPGPILCYTAPCRLDITGSTFEAGFTYGVVESRVAAEVHLHNCILNSNALADWTGDDPREQSWVASEDHEQVAGAMVATSYTADITKDTGVLRIGGAASSMKVMPRSGVSSSMPLLLPVMPSQQFLPVWCPAQATTITVYIRSVTTWGGTYPTASELYMTASYPNSATTGARSTATSTQVLSDATTWVAFTMAFTPLRAGFVYLSLYLSKYVASNGIYIDVEPTIS